jgi:hypothetical protein
MANSLLPERKRGSIGQRLFEVNPTSHAWASLWTGSLLSRDQMCFFILTLTTQSG